MNETRLEQQMNFIIEIDKLKEIIRQSYLISGGRKENSAEHSWHVAMMAMILADYFDPSIELLRVLKMLLTHDIIEIDAGDTYAFDVESRKDKQEREKSAAQRIFALLPQEQGTELLELWKEFETCETAESRFAATMDRIMPLLHNYHTQGRSWHEHGVTSAQVIERLKFIKAYSEEIWEFVSKIIQDSVHEGYLIR